MNDKDNVVEKLFATSDSLRASEKTGSTGKTIRGGGSRVEHCPPAAMCHGVTTGQVGGSVERYIFT